MFAKLSENGPSKPSSQAEIEVPKADNSVHNTPQSRAPKPKRTNSGSDAPSGKISQNKSANPIQTQPPLAPQ